MNFLHDFLGNFIEVSLEAAPWLLFGLLAAGLIKAWVPESFMQRVLGGKGGWPVIKAALIGAPLPLCSCGVLPAAIGLRRAGASRGATLSFLIATPETGVDSIGISYVLLGPFMTVIRVVAAIGSAIVTGMLAVFILGRTRPSTSMALDAGIGSYDPGCCSVPSKDLQVSDDCCSSGSCSSKPAVHVVEKVVDKDLAETTTDCCSSAECPTDSNHVISGKLTFWQRNVFGIKYALSNVWDDIAAWLLLGLVLAGLLATIVPAQALAEWGSGLPAMILMLIVGVPMYICATASTPLAAGLLLTGISPGTILVLLLAGPATNMATIAIIFKEMGRAIVFVYLTGIAVSSIAFGLLTDYIVVSNNIDINAQIDGVTEVLPEWVAIVSAILLLMAAIKPLRKYAIGC